MRVFIAHASEQNDIAETIAQAIRNRRIEVFVDQQVLQAGYAFDERIEKEIAAADVFLFLVSPESISPGRYTLTEIKHARQKWPNPEGHVLPVLVAPTELNKIPTYLRSVTLLEPKGNLAAEVAGEVMRLKHASLNSTKRAGQPLIYWFGSLSAMLLTLAGGAWASSQFLRCNAQLGELACSFKEASAREMFGHYLSLDNHGEPKCVSEKINLRFSYDNVRVEAIATGLVHEQNNEQKFRSWTFRGYQYGRLISMAYVSDERPPQGSGVYSLISRGGEYHGHWTGIDFPTEKIVRCPYVLSKSLHEGECHTRWPDVFAQSCEMLTE